MKVEFNVKKRVKPCAYLSALKGDYINKKKL